MAEIVNLRMARKRRAREDNIRQADENRIRHGLTKIEKRANESGREREIALHEAHRREPTGEDDGA